MAEVAAPNDRAAAAEQAAEEGGAFDLAAAGRPLGTIGETAVLVAGVRLGIGGAGERAEQNCCRSHHGQANGGLVGHFRGLSILHFLRSLSICPTGDHSDIDTIDSCMCDFAHKKKSPPSPKISRERGRQLQLRADGKATCTESCFLCVSAQWTENPVADELR